jgi:hypothetical protein
MDLLLAKPVEAEAPAVPPPAVEAEAEAPTVPPPAVEAEAPTVPPPAVEAPVSEVPAPAPVPAAPPAPSVPASTDAEYKNLRVAKRFKKRIYFGTITSTWVEDTKGSMYHVMYDDKDEEDFEQKEVDNARKLYEKSKDKDYITYPEKKPKRSAPKKRKAIDSTPTRSVPKRGAD